jgi:hypothetical protein
MRWNIRGKTIFPFCVGLVSDRELTKEEYDYPLSSEFKKKIKEAMKEYSELYKP